jgi:hypothetical protein
MKMIKQAGTAGYVSISGRKIAGILLILICSFALAWAARGGKGSSVGFVNVKPARPLMAHTNHTRMGGQHVSPARHNHSTATGQARTHQKQGALSNFNKHTKQSSSQAGHSKGAGQGANQGAGGGVGGVGDSGSGADQGAGQGAKANSETSPTPVPEESPGPTSDTTLGSSAMMTGTSRWPRAAATPSSWAATPAPLP